MCYLNYPFKKICFFISVPVFCFATNFGGEWGNSAYLYKNRLDTVQSLANFYENLNFHAININGSDISAYTDLNATNGFTSPDRKKFEVNHLFLDWRDIGAFADIRVGRQRVYEGCKSTYLDGLSLESRITNAISLSGYGGLQVPSRFSSSFVTTNRDSSPAEIGLRARGNFKQTNIGLSFFDSHDRSKNLEQDLGADLTHSFGKKLFLKSDFIYKIDNGKLNDLDLLLDFKPSDRAILTAAYNVNYSLPETLDVFASKIFQNYQQLRFNTLFFISSATTIETGYLYRTLDDNSVNHEFECLVNHGPLSAGFQQLWGYGGFSTAGNASVRFWKTSLSEIEAGANVTRYGFSDTVGTALYAWLGRLAIDFTPTAPWLDSRLEFQGLRNRYYKYDARILFMTHVRFSKFTKQ